LTITLWHFKLHSPLSLPSPAKGEGHKSPFLEGRGKEEGAFGAKLYEVYQSYFAIK
jgi:hypothetical protein